MPTTFKLNNMRLFAAVIFLLLGISCIVGAIEAFQMSQELSLQALRLEWDLVNFDWEEYQSVSHKASAYGRMFGGFLVGIILFLASSVGLFIKEP